MPDYMFIHPFFGLLAGVLILATFYVKYRANKLKTPHYVLGGLTVLTVLLATGSALCAMYTFYTEFGSLDKIPLIVFIPHALLAALLTLIVLGQSSGGILIRLKPALREKVYPIHKKNGLFIAILTFLVMVLGGITVSLMLFQP